MSARDLLLQTVAEREWQAQVLRWARDGSWTAYHAYDSRRSAPGFPDIVLGRSGQWGQAEVLFVELKRETGRLTPAQRGWLELLEWAGLECHVWKPSDHAEARARLLGGG